MGAMTSKLRHAAAAALETRDALQVDADRARTRFLLNHILGIAPERMSNERGAATVAVDGVTFTSVPNVIGYGSLHVVIGEGGAAAASAPIASLADLGQFLEMQSSTSKQSGN